MVATRLLCLWDFPGKNTGVDCHFLFQGELPNPGTEPRSLVLQVISYIAGRFFTDWAIMWTIFWGWREIASMGIYMKKSGSYLFGRTFVPLVAQAVKNLPAIWVQFLGWVWSLGSGRSPGEGNGNPLQYSFLEDSMDIGAWRATVLEVTKSWTWLSGLTIYLHCSTWMRTTGSVKLLIYRGSFRCLGLVHWWFSLAETQGYL